MADVLTNDYLQVRIVSNAILESEIVLKHESEVMPTPYQPIYDTALLFCGPTDRMRSLLGLFTPRTGSLCILSYVLSRARCLPL